MKDMNIVPIVFCFDDNLLLPAGVCIASLLENAYHDTFYDIFVLHDDSAQYPESKFLEKLHERYHNFSIKYRSVGNAFNNAFEIRGITVAAYYRLLIPELIPEYDKIMYHDVDVIFRSDLTAVYRYTDMNGFYIAGVVSPAALDKKLRDSRLKMNLNPDSYILSGNLIFNSFLMRKDSLVESLKKEAQKNYTYQDQDVLNVICKGKVKRLSPVFCSVIGIFELAANKTKQSLYSLTELEQVEKSGIVHYNGPKPWSSWCPNFDIWWEYYRKSVYFDEKYYFDFYHSKVNELDRLSLWKRIKLVLRYFTTGQLKK